MDITDEGKERKRLSFARKIYLLSLAGMSLGTIFLIYSIISFAENDMNSLLTSIFIFMFFDMIFFIGIVNYLYITKSFKLNIKPVTVDIPQRDRPLRGLRDIILNPTLTFQSVKETNWVKAVLYYAFITGAILFLIIIEIIGSKMWLNTTFLFYTALFIYYYIVFLCLLFISGFILHIAVRLLGSTKGISQSIKTVAYASFPSIVLFFIPILPNLWSLYLMVIGVRELHELPNDRAFFAVIMFGFGFSVVIIILLSAMAFSQFNIFSYIPS